MILKKKKFTSRGSHRLGLAVKQQNNEAFFGALRLPLLSLPPILDIWSRRRWDFWRDRYEEYSTCYCKCYSVQRFGRRGPEDKGMRMHASITPAHLQQPRLSTSYNFCTLFNNPDCFIPTSVLLPLTSFSLLSPFFPLLQLLRMEYWINISFSSSSLPPYRFSSFFRRRLLYAKHLWRTASSPLIVSTTLSKSGKRRI